MSKSSARPFTSLSCTLRTLILLQTHLSCFLSLLPAFLHSSFLPFLMLSSKSFILSCFFPNFLFLRTIPSTLSLSPPPNDFSTSLHFVLFLCITFLHITCTTFFMLAHAACFSLPLKRPFLASPLFRYFYTSLLSSLHIFSHHFPSTLHYTPFIMHTYTYSLLPPPLSTSSVPLLSILLHSIISPFLSITSNFQLHPFNHAHPRTLLLFWFSRSPRRPPGPSSASLCSGNDSSSSL